MRKGRQKLSELGRAQPMQLVLGGLLGRKFFALVILELDDKSRCVPKAIEFFGHMIILAVDHAESLNNDRVLIPGFLIYFFKHGILGTHPLIYPASQQCPPARCTSPSKS